MAYEKKGRCYASMKSFCSSQEVYRLYNLLFSSKNTMFQGHFYQGSVGFRLHVQYLLSYSSIRALLCQESHLFIFTTSLTISVMSSTPLFMNQSSHNTITMESETWRAHKASVIEVPPSSFVRQEFKSGYLSSVLLSSIMRLKARRRHPQPAKNWIASDNWPLRLESTSESSSRSEWSW